MCDLYPVSWSHIPNKIQEIVCYTNNSGEVLFPCGQLKLAKLVKNILAA